MTQPFSWSAYLGEDQRQFSHSPSEHPGLFQVPLVAFRVPEPHVPLQVRDHLIAHGTYLF